MSGFIAMQREALDHPLLQDAERFRAWFWLIANAAWKPTRTRIKGQMVTLERGEMTFSVRFLAEAWGWSKSRVDRFLSDLREEGMIATRSKIGTTAGHKAGQGQSIITICNYEKYQVGENRKRDNSEPESGTTAGQQRDKEEQGNNNTPYKAPKGAGSKSIIPEDWTVPPVDDLTPKARACAEQWPRDVYETHGEAFYAYWRSKRRMMSDWRLTWANRVISLHSQVMRDQRFSTGPPLGRGEQPSFLEHQLQRQRA